MVTLDLLLFSPFIFTSVTCSYVSLLDKHLLNTSSNKDFFPSHVHFRTQTAQRILLHCQNHLQSEGGSVGSV